jgi:hypothetical protein
MNTGDAKLYYRNENNKLLGTNMKYMNDPTTNILGKLLEKIREEIKQNYNENLLYEPYMALSVLENVFQTKENVSEYISMIENTDYLTFDTIIDKYGREKIKTKIPYDIVFDDEVLEDVLHKYDWLHLHHEDFTGQHGKFHRNFGTYKW